MTASFLRSSLLLSFIAAINLTAGVLLYRHFNPVGLIELPPESMQRLDMIGTPAPEISLTDLDGQTVVLSQLRGRTVLINFWATWCPPCVKEIPLLVEYHERLRDHGLTAIGVAIDEIEPVRRFAQAHHFSYPVVQATFTLMEQFGNLPGTMPYTVLVDQHGRIAGQYFIPLERHHLDMILADQIALAEASAAGVAADPSTAAASSDKTGDTTEENNTTKATDSDDTAKTASPDDTAKTASPDGISKASGPTEAGEAASRTPTSSHKPEPVISDPAVNEK